MLHSPAMTVAQTENTCQRERKAWVADEPGSLLSVIIALTSLSAKTDNREMFTINTKPTYLAFFQQILKPVLVPLVSGVC